MVKINKCDELKVKKCNFQCEKHIIDQNRNTYKNLYTAPIDNSMILKLAYIHYRHKSKRENHNDIITRKITKTDCYNSMIFMIHSVITIKVRRYFHLTPIHIKDSSCLQIQSTILCYFLSCCLQCYSTLNSCSRPTNIMYF